MTFADLYPRASYAKAAVLGWWRDSDFRDLQAPNADPERKAAAADQIKAAREADSADRAKLEAHEKEVWHPAVLAWMRQLRDAGRLRPVAGMAGRQSNLPDAWNAFVAGNAKEWQERDVSRMFDRLFVSAIVNGSFEQRKDEDRPLGTLAPPSDDKIDASYRKIVEALDEGTLGIFETGDGDYDHISGDRLNLVLEGWEPKLLRRNESYEFVPAEDVAPIGTQTVEVDFPTGDLLISDWIRVPGFREATKLEYSRDLDINSDRGAIRTTEEHAKRHHFAFVQTTNTSVVVHEADGRIMVSQQWDRRDEDTASAEGMTEAGTFSCDLWGVTLIDRVTVLELMQIGGCENPEGELDRYLASDDAYAGNIVRMKVQPGRWRIHFGPEFAERADRKALGIPDGPEPWLLMERVGDMG